MDRLAALEGAGAVARLSARRVEANTTFFAAEAERIARLCGEMAERFTRGGRLIAVGSDAAARSDMRHVAVEFVHPVIVGKRALPALALAPERLSLVVRDEDIVMAFGVDVPGAMVGFDCQAEWHFAPPSPDPFVQQEIFETTYHVLWELVHTFLEQDGPVRDMGAASFLYPSVAGAVVDAEALVADVRASVGMKAEEIAALREQTLGENAGVLEDAGRILSAAFDHGRCVLALGNGGSATDAMDAVADLVDPPHGWPARPALDLTEDPSIITAIANDVGVENIFARQVIAYGRPGDVVLAFSTSGDSGNVISALAEARRRGLATIAMVGYDGGQIARDTLADFVVVSRSQHIPRIQEAQASAWHVLRELVELA